MMILGQFVVSFGYFVGLVFLFDRFGGLIGWNFAEVALCFGVSGTAFSLTCFVSRGFDVFQRYIRSGDFDRLLLRPRSLFLQVFCLELGSTQIGRAAQSFLVLLYAISRFESWSAARSLGVLLMVLSGVAIFTGVYMLGATVCFWTVKGLEFVNIFSDGGKEIASYPLTIFNKWMTRFFTFILPYACFNYLPLQYVAGRSNQLGYLLFPVLGMLFVLPCMAVWLWGLRHYVSTGS
jgi:ABC-2 type transport system permease protein